MALLDFGEVMISGGARGIDRGYLCQIDIL